MHAFEKNDLAWIWASRLGRPVKKITELLKTEFGNLEDAFDAVSCGALTQRICENTRFAERLRDVSRIDEAKSIYNNAVKAGMRIIHVESELYPEYLKEISNAPAVLYCYGKLPAEIESEQSEKLPLLALVGARNCSAYGYGTALKFSRVLSALGVGIVSGMARGIDSAAHKGAIDSDSYTVAVLGCGADVVYPSENRHLYGEIKKKGCIISEFIPGSAPVRNHFPARNRIIAGMSRAVTVIEAGESSGAMITAGLAGEMGRDVYAVPGNIDSSLSFGANKLIQSGALCVTSHIDIIEELGLTSFGSGTANTGIKHRELSDFDEKSVYNAVRNGCCDINRIYEKTGIPFGKIRSILGVLEINGMITKNYDGFYFVSDWNC